MSVAIGFNNGFSFFLGVSFKLIDGSGEGNFGEGNGIQNSSPTLKLFAA